MERRDHVPDIGVVAGQLVEDLSPNPDGPYEFLDAVGTIGAHDMTENDLTALCIELARRLIVARKP